MRQLCLILVLLLVPLCAANAESKQDKDKKLQELIGCWQDTEDNATLVRFEAERCTTLMDGKLSIGKIVKYKADPSKSESSGPIYKLILRVYGDLGEYAVKQDAQLLIFTYAQGAPEEKIRKLSKLDKIPPEIITEPLKLGKSGPIPPEKVQQIIEELDKRIVEDQAVRKDAGRKGDMGQVDSDNTAYLKDLIGSIGWIDVKRFGVRTATNAFLIVQHSGDLPLMMAALPEIEKDLKAKIGDPQDYALLFDRLQLRLGEKQRYGSQIGNGKNGQPSVFPLEDKSKVEQFRKEIGLFPLAQYLDIYKQQTGAKEIKYMEDEQNFALYYDNAMDFYYEKKYEESIKTFKEAIRVMESESSPYYSIACCYCLMKKTKDGLTWFEKALAHGYKDADNIKKDTDIDSIRKEPKFKELLKKYNLEKE